MSVSKILISICSAAIAGVAVGVLLTSSTKKIRREDKSSTGKSTYPGDLALTDPLYSKESARPRAEFNQVNTVGHMLNF